MLFPLLLALALPQDTAVSIPGLTAESTLVNLAPTRDNLSLLGTALRQMPVSVRSADTVPLLLSPSDDPDDSLQAQRPKAFHYSDGYYTRLRVHQLASYLTIPLFAAQFWSGQTMWDNPDSHGFAKSVHGPLAASVAGLFAVNTVTGVWNLWEGRKDPNGRTRRIIHSVLMLTADAGFVATGASAPDDDFGEGGSTSHSSGASRHRNLAIGSMGVALSSYLMMLIWKD